MADFYKAFEAIDEDGSGEITVEELQQYMIKNNYKENFVSKWLKLFDDDNCGKITYQHYCETLGLVPKDRVTINKDDETQKGIVEKDVKKESSDLKLLKRNSPQSKTKNSETVILKASEVQKEEQKIEMTLEKPKSQEVNSKEVKRKNRSPKSYPIQVKQKGPRHRRTLFSKHKRHLRASIQPGVIMILLAGQHKGKRVVFLKQLNSGLLLVTGPFKLNRCPLRRVHQQMVIATKTRLDISEVKVPDHITDSYFARESDKRQTTTDVSAIFAKKKKEYVLKDERKHDQVCVDKQVLTAIKGREDKSVLVKYLKSSFSLSSHDCPHLMEF